MAKSDSWYTFSASELQDWQREERIAAYRGYIFSPSIESKYWGVTFPTTNSTSVSLSVKKRGCAVSSKQAGRNYFCQSAVTRPDILSTVRDLSKYVVKV